jgi:dinuclear metal center YbgI/SA1388 family protein
MRSKIIVKRDKIVEFLNNKLKIKRYKEKPKQGLSVKGKKEVDTIGVATDLTLKVIKSARKKGVNFIFTHHTSWPSMDNKWKGKRGKLKRSKISHYYAHSALDGNKEFGTSAILAKKLGIDAKGRFSYYYGGDSGVFGDTNTKFKVLLEKCNKIGWIRYYKQHNKIKRVGIVAGAGDLIKDISEAKKLGCDTYITGEYSSFLGIWAKENNINLICLGHSASELPAVLEVGKLLKKRFGVRVIKLYDYSY